MAQPQAEHQPQRQGSLDCQIGIAGLATACSPLRCLLGRQGLRRHPECQVATPTKTCLMFWPVRHFGLHLANTMAAGGGLFEEHRAANQLFRVPITYAAPINDPRTNAHLISIPVTNTSVNPARSTAVAFFAQTGALGQLWLGCAPRRRGHRRLDLEGAWGKRIAVQLLALRPCVMVDPAMKAWNRKTRTAICGPCQRGYRVLAINQPI